MNPPIYIKIRKLNPGESVALTVDYQDLGQVFIDLDVNNEIVGVEILDYVEIRGRKLK